jgi:hypothetical protein
VYTHELQNNASCRYKIIYGSAVLLLLSSQNAMRATRQTINRPTGIPIRVLLNKTQAPSHTIHYFGAQKAFIHGHEALRAADTKQHTENQFWGRAVAAVVRARILFALAHHAVGNNCYTLPMCY